MVPAAALVPWMPWDQGGHVSWGDGSPCIARSPRLLLQSPRSQVHATTGEGSHSFRAWKRAWKHNQEMEGIQAGPPCSSGVAASSFFMPVFPQESAEKTPSCPQPHPLGTKPTALTLLPILTLPPIIQGRTVLDAQQVQQSKSSCSPSQPGDTDF